jgi:hypothetical protein
MTTRIRQLPDGRQHPPACEQAVSASGQSHYPAEWRIPS